MKYPDITEDYLREQYIVNGRTKKEIAEEKDILVPMVSGLLTKYGLRKFKASRHGLSKHPLNYIWNGIKEQCRNQNASNYRWYGAKGITVCDEWLSFPAFYEWAISNGWVHGMSIDRVDNELGYSLEARPCYSVTGKSESKGRVILLQSGSIVAGLITPWRK